VSKYFLKKQKKKEKNYTRERNKQRPAEHLCISMALPLQVLSVSLLLLIVLPDVLATAPLRVRGYGAHHAVRVRGHRIQLPKHHRPKFKPGPWKQAHATFYEGGSGTYGMNACLMLRNQIALTWYFFCYTKRKGKNKGN
jgi:hypothetical protein